jgi:hypothetical protein
MDIRSAHKNPTIKQNTNNREKHTKNYTNKKHTHAHTNRNTHRHLNHKKTHSHRREKRSTTKASQTLVDPISHPTNCKGILFFCGLSEAY